MELKNTRYKIRQKIINMTIEKSKCEFICRYKKHGVKWHWHTVLVSVVSEVQLVILSHIENFENMRVDYIITSWWVIHHGYIISISEEFP